MLNKLILRAFLSISLAVTFTGAANAALITQDILDGNNTNIGFITIDTSNLDEFDSVLTWEAFNILGFDMEAPEITDANQFYAAIDPTDFFAGIFDIQFDLVDVLGAFQWAGGTFIDTDDTVDSYGITVNQLGAENPPLVGYISSFSFGEATVVPTPATFVLFLTAIAGLAARRKNH